jgi:tetratricopeptide (TPR) repeat protein
VNTTLKRRPAPPQKPKILSEVRLEVAETLDKVGGALDFQRRTDEALELMTKAHGIRAALLRDSDPVLARSYSQLGSMYALRGRDHEALPLLEEALKINLRAFGPTSPEAAESYVRLWEWHLENGTRDEAERYQKKAIEADYQPPEWSG